MFAPPKVKDPRKRSKKSKRHRIEDGIPERPNQSDFQIVYRSEAGTSAEIEDSQECTVDSKTDESEHERTPEAASSQAMTNVDFDASIVEGVNDVSSENDVIDVVNDLEVLNIKLTEKDTATEHAQEAPVIEQFEIHGYENLRNEVKHCIHDLNLPSAPLITIVESVDAVESDNITNYVSDEVLNTAVELKDKNVEEYFLDESIEDTEVPYTETELLQFYQNKELSQCTSSISEFIQQALIDSRKAGNKLYELLDGYLKSRINISLNQKEIDNLQKAIKGRSGNLWQVSTVSLQETEKCLDGNRVTFHQSYLDARLNEDVFSTFQCNLSEMEEALFKAQSWDSFHCKVYKLKIECYLYLVMTSCKEFTDMEKNSPAKLIQFSSNTYFQECFEDLKTSISILFHFQRLRKIESDAEFLAESRKWLSNLVSILIRVGGWKDHIFLLNHILRCPGGVGEWAANFVQTPRTASYNPFSDYEVNHMMTVLFLILHPIDKRDNFLEDWSVTKNDDNPWVVVDSEGEDDDQQFCPLRENDLVLLLNQIPFGYIFESVLYFKDGRCNIVDIDHLLQLLAFLTDFITIVHTGLKLYSSQKYKQFTKRLGRLIRHAVQYATDALILFKASRTETEELSTRLQVEYDSFFLKATKYIYSSQRYGAWQFLAVVPYSMASTNAILKLYTNLQLSTHVSPNRLQINLPDFEEKFVLLPECEQFYLLSTFTNMALARDLSEIRFIKTVTFQLFYIGFLGHASKDSCYKSAKSLLSNICSVHPFFMSDILRFQNERFSADPTREQSLTVYLWMELPVEMWSPDSSDLKILEDWLLEPVQTVKNELARTILRSLNYNTKNNEFVLEPNVHLSVALMIMKANAKLVPETDIYTMRNVSMLVRTQTPESNLQQWSWNLLFKLRLHLVDRIDNSPENQFENIHENLRNVPEVESMSEVHQLVERKNPIACFVALMATTLGHSVPLIFNRGFQLVEVLINWSKHEAALACMENMTIMFLECSDSLYKCEKFVSVLNLLIAADNSYLKMAKNLISPEFPGAVLTSLGNMIQNQMSNVWKLKLKSMFPLVELWTSCLTKIPLWTQEQGISYLLDILIGNSFLDNPSRNYITALFRTLIEENKPQSETKSSFSSLVSWINTTSLPATLLPPKGYNGSAPWLSYLIQGLEHELNEQMNSLWSDLLIEIHSTGDKKANIDNSLKKVCNNLHIPVRPSSSLAIYKWANLVLEMYLSHPLVIPVWQEFFTLYLARVRGPVDRGSVGEKFFEGIVNQTLLKRLKAKLQETREHFSITEKECVDEDRKAYLLECVYLLETFLLWLDEPRLHEPCLNLHSLPTKSKPKLLGMLIYGNKTVWFEYLDRNKLFEQIRNGANVWMKTKHRVEKKSIPKSNSKSEDKTPDGRIMECLKSYESPANPPCLNLEKPPIPLIVHPLSQKSTINGYFEVFSAYMKAFSLYLDEYSFHVGKLSESAKYLYKSTARSIQLQNYCDEDGTGSEYFIRKCKGPARIKLNFIEYHLDGAVNRNFAHLLASFHNKVDVIRSYMPEPYPIAAVALDYFIREIIKPGDITSPQKSGEVEAVGVHLFYRIVRMWSRDVDRTPTIRGLFNEFTQLLGNAFIRQNQKECSKLLAMMYEDEELVDILCPYFTPNTASTNDFVDLYGRVVKSVTDVTFSILTKFDVLRWLVENKPKFVQRTNLISHIGQCLKADGSGPSRMPHVRELLNNHLEILLLYDFPEHYGNILQFLLDASALQSISPSTWFTFLNALVPPGMSFSEGQNEVGKTFEPRFTAKKMKQHFSKYATEQTRLSFVNIKSTITVLANFFKNDRLKHGLYGLYPKFRLYMEPIMIFFGMLSHACVVKTLEVGLGTLSGSIAEQLWLMFDELFSPWLVPYWTNSEKSQTAAWIRDLTDDRCLLLPWTVNDCCYASFAAKIFVESIHFVIDTLPGVKSVLSYLWCYYVTNYAHADVKDHVLGVIHKTLVTLPWFSFFPSLQDIESMLKVVNQFLPQCHAFLGSIFVEVKWTEVVHHHLATYDFESKVRLHVCLLNLLVKLPSEPTLKQNKTITTLLTEANGYAWHLIDVDCYSSVLTWFIMSCDPRIILMDERSEYFQLDSITLKLLQCCAGYVPTAKQFHPTTLNKRLMFIMASVKWLITANCKYKCKNSVLFKSALCTIWSDMENILTATVPKPQRIDEAAIMLSEFLNILKETDLVPLVEETLIHWLETRKSTVVVFGLLRSACSSIENPAVFGSITEACLNNYFEFTENCDWSEITLFLPFPRSSLSIEKSLLKNGNFLTLYAFWLKKLQDVSDTFKEKVITGDIFQILSTAKPSETNEPKLALLMVLCLKLIDNRSLVESEQTKTDLVKFMEVVNVLANQKGSGFLSSIGLKKSASASNRLKLVCLASNGGILKILKTNYYEGQDGIEERLSQILEQLDHKQFNNISQHAASARSYLEKVDSIAELIKFLNRNNVVLFNKMYLK